MKGVWFARLKSRKTRWFTCTHLLSQTWIPHQSILSFLISSDYQYFHSCYEKCYYYVDTNSCFLPVFHTCFFVFSIISPAAYNCIHDIFAGISHLKYRCWMLRIGYIVLFSVECRQHCIFMNSSLSITQQQLTHFFSSYISSPELLPEESG